MSFIKAFINFVITIFTIKLTYHGLLSCNILFHEISVGYFYQDGIVKLMGLQPRIDRTISKETLYSSSQRYNISR
jgi:hypothetical protein